MLLTGTALGQAPVGSISGITTDPSGAVVAGPSVTSASLADGGTRSGLSNDQGFFLIPTLLPGDYKVVVAAKGFRNYEVQRVHVEVGQSARVDAILTVGAETLAIEVNG